MALALQIVACAAACVVYWFVPYEPGPWHQRWTVTVSHDGRTAASTGFGLGRCGDEGAHGATVAKRGALGRACFSAGLCPGGDACDCAASASVRAVLSGRRLAVVCPGRYVNNFLIVGE